MKKPIFACFAVILAMASSPRASLAQASAQATSGPCEWSCYQPVDETGFPNGPSYCSIDNSQGLATCEAVGLGCWVTFCAGASTAGFFVRNEDGVPSYAHVTDCDEATNAEIPLRFAVFSPEETDEPRSVAS